MMTLSKAERETIIRWSDDRDEPISVFTHNERVSRLLVRRGAKIAQVSKIEGKVVAWSLLCPREWTTVFPRPKRKARVLTDAQRELAAKRLSIGRTKRAEVAS